MIQIQQTLERISSLQNQNGSFPGSSSTIYGSILVATLLNELIEYSTQDITDKLFIYIQKQRHPDGSFGYWEINSKEEELFPYPTDLDDTALAMAATIKTITGDAISSFIKLLTSAEIIEGGPYNTWLTNEDPWKDCDLGVNANIAYALALLGVTLPNLEKLFENAIQTKEINSKYYHLPLMILFFISRSYKGNAVDCAVEKILSLQENGQWNTKTETALALCALSNFGYDISSFESAIAYLITEGVALDPLYREYIHNGAVSFYTNEALSLSLIALALHRYEQSRMNTDPISTVPYEAIQSACIEQCGIFGDIAKRYSDILLAEPISKDALALPYILSTKHDPQIPKKLAVAQFSGMMGYTIIDSILDDETNCQDLPFALYCIRRFSDHYYTLYPGNSFFNYVMNQTDFAFAQEYNNRLERTPEGFLIEISNFEPISWQKSYGYALPAFALYPDHHNQIASFFQSYLYAKQLHDDAHDVIEDLANGQVTVVGKLILEKYVRACPNKTTYAFPNDEEEFRILFWNDCFPAIFSLISSSITQASESLAVLPFENKLHFEHMLNKIRAAQEHAALERDRIISFLTSY